LSINWRAVISRWRKAGTIEQGIRLSRECQERLSQAERRIEVLLRDNQGRPVATPFDEKQATADRNEMKMASELPPQTASDLVTFSRKCRASIDAELDRLLPTATTAPEKVHQAIRWSVFAGGKRFRPALLLAVGQTFQMPNACYLTRLAPWR